MADERSAARSGKPGSTQSAAEKAARRAVEPVEQAAKVLRAAGRHFAERQASSGIALLAAAVLALALSNSPLAHLYALLLEARLTVEIEDIGFDNSLLHWINEGLMAMFFFVVGLELKREIKDGRLSDPSAVVLPLLAAAGGIIVPGATYAAVNAGEAGLLRGWAIPTATDIAFALGVLALLGGRVPPALRIFLLTLAIFDDVAAIGIIAAFYSAALSTLALALAAAALAVLLVLNLAGVGRTAAYVLVGIALWFFVVRSGVHATLAGVLLALTIPLEDRNGQSPLRRLEEHLNPWIAYAVMPVFAFANAGVSVFGLTVDSLYDPVTLGIALGLIVGKPLGVMAAVFAAVRLGWAALPSGATWPQVYGVALVTGIGFTMSLFIGTLAFEDTRYAPSMRLGVLGGSIVSALAGYAALRLAGSRRAHAG